MKTSEYKDFKGNGTENRKGLFMGKLYDKIKDYNIPIIGVNRKYINKSLKELEHLLNIDQALVIMLLYINNGID